MLVTRADDAFFVRRLSAAASTRKRIEKGQYSLLYDSWFKYNGILRNIKIDQHERKIHDRQCVSGSLHVATHFIPTALGAWIYITNMIPCGDSMRGILVAQLGDEHVLYTIQLRGDTISVIDSQSISLQSCSPAIHVAYDSIAGKLHKFIFKHNHVATDIDSKTYYTASGAIIDIVIHGGIVTIYGNDTLERFDAGYIISRRVIPRASCIRVVGDFLTARMSEHAMRIHDIRTDDEYDIDIADDEDIAIVIPVFCTTKLKSCAHLCISGNDRNTRWRW